MIEFYDIYLGGKRPGKGDRGASGKKPVLVATEARGKKAEFMAIKAVEKASKETVRKFLHHCLKGAQTVRTDAFPALNSLSETYQHQKKMFLQMKLLHGCLWPL